MRQLWQWQLSSGIGSGVGGGDGVNTLPPDSCGHCPHPVDRTFKLSTLQLRSTVRVPLNEHNFSQYKHI